MKVRELCEETTAYTVNSMLIARRLLLGKLATMLGVAFVMVLSWGMPVAADVNDFTITNFSADETLTGNDPQGELRIIEHIYLVFSDQNHGILRALPTTYKGQTLKLKVNQITSDTGAPSQYSTYDSNGNTVLKIGDPNRTVTGSQEYTIDYSVDNVIAFYKDHDELYWDINGDQWDQQFVKVSEVLHLPAGLQQTTSPLCFSGTYGNTAQDCTAATNGQTIFVTNRQPLSPRQTVTLVASFQKGYFHPATFWDVLHDKLLTVLSFALLPVLVGAGCLYAWLRIGRDAKGRGTIVPEYGPPDNLRPIEVGTLIDFKVDNRDITATIIDLAIRKYIKIIETKQDHLLRPDTTQYTLQLMNADYSALTGYEREIMSNLFAEGQVDDLVDISVLKNKFYTTADKVRKVVELNLTTLGYFRSNPLSSTKKFGGAAAALFIICWLLPHTLAPALLFSLLISGVIIFITSKFIASRTAKGVAAIEHIEGLKLYLKTAEADRLKLLQGPNARYAENYQAPTKTVDLFEKLLPYAMVLGVEKEWAKQFEGIYTSAPDWYAGNWSTFNAVYLTNSLNAGMVAAVNTAFSAPNSSSSSGFGGGGFAGGGGGGGGGGGW